MKAIKNLEDKIMKIKITVDENNFRHFQTYPILHLHCNRKQ